MNEKEIIYGMALVKSGYDRVEESLEYILCTEQAAELITPEQRMILVQSYSILSRINANLVFHINELLKGE